MVSVEQSVEWELAGGTEVLGENLPQCHFIHHKSHMTWPGIEAGHYPPELFHCPILGTYFYAKYREHDVPRRKYSSEGRYARQQPIER
jgi:hypothetical protein